MKRLRKIKQKKNKGLLHETIELLLPSGNKCKRSSTIQAWSKALRQAESDGGMHLIQSFFCRVATTAKEVLLYIKY